MFKKIIVKSGEYYDSITLLQVSKELLQTTGVKEAAVVMGTPANKELLANIELLTDEGSSAQANDLMIAVLAENESSLTNALNEAEKLLKNSRSNFEKDITGINIPRTIHEGIQQLPQANLAVISVAGNYAATVAHDALSQGLNVFIFSDNVSLKDEIELKRIGAKKKLFVMGPDAGTAIINGVALGFANQVLQGSVGIVAASGTGLQFVSSAISEMGAGISQAIGVGGRDISKDVGGIMMLQGLKTLQEDPATKVIVLVSKPPSSEIKEKILANINSQKKLTVVCFLGDNYESEITLKGSVLKVNDLEEASYFALSILKNESIQIVINNLNKQYLQLKAKALELKKDLNAKQKYFRGLFCGGSFCYETQSILNNITGFGPVFSNAPLNKADKLDNVNKSIEHTALDLGDDDFTVGRLHPMMDSTIRKMRLLQESRDPEVAIIYLDFVLGHGVHEDPVGSIYDALVESQKIAAQDGRKIIYLASVCGTKQDPQNLLKQEDTLKNLGVIVLPSNASAAKLVGLIL